MEGSNLKTFAKLIFEFLRLIFRSKQDIVLENLALRQQLIVQQRSIKRPKIKNRAIGQDILDFHVRELVTFGKGHRERPWQP